MILEVGLGDRSYDIVLERGCLAQASQLLNLNRKVLIVTDSGVPAQYAQSVADQCAEPLIVTVPQGENSKSLEVFGQLMEAMVQASFTRKDAVVAVGGGVVGDLAGYAAASYMRGVDFYNIPTTVLSQVDSSIGGKTAINMGGYKNMVGAFYQPKKVLIDLDVLQTLPARQIANGLAEAVKMSLTSDARLFALFEEIAAGTRTLDDSMEAVIEGSLRIKKYVVEQDEREMGLRKILNFGHTIGHGVEAYMQELYGEEGTDAREAGLYHGECVALGMIPLCAEPVRQRLLPVLEALNLPTTCAFDEDAVVTAMKHDKKGDAASVTIITVPQVGSFAMEQTTAQDLGSKLFLIQKKEA